MFINVYICIFSILYTEALYRHFSMDLKLMSFNRTEVSLIILKENECVCVEEGDRLCCS